MCHEFSLDFIILNQTTSVYTTDPFVKYRCISGAVILIANLEQPTNITCYQIFCISIMSWISSMLRIRQPVKRNHIPHKWVSLFPTYWPYISHHNDKQFSLFITLLNTSTVNGNETYQIPLCDADCIVWTLQENLHSL